MIIIEGCDGSGKSTLIANLGYEGLKLKSLRGGVGGTQQNGLGDGDTGWAGIGPALLAYHKKIKEIGSRRIACDRFHLSEIVYGPLLRHRQELDAQDLSLLNAFLHQRQIPVVMCLPPFEVTLANVARAGRERPAYQTDEFLHQAYEAFVRLTPWATVIYDFTCDPIPNIS
jgi:thymidylate kinase